MSIVAAIELLAMIGNAYPKVAPMVKDLLSMFKGIPVVDITQEELEMRVDAAIAKLPVWG